MMKVNKDYLIGSEVIIEVDCLPILGMTSGCATPYLTMLRWIAYIKYLNLEICHIARKNNAMADMLPRAMFKHENDMVSKDEVIALDFFKMAQFSAEDEGMPTLNTFHENE